PVMGGLLVSPLSLLFLFSPFLLHFSSAITEPCPHDQACLIFVFKPHDDSYIVAPTRKNKFPYREIGNLSGFALHHITSIIGQPSTQQTLEKETVLLVI
ncbi:hypothetical protein PENTCL1PPCAC_2967, partial [Pristionchus entomophagus]